MRDILSDLDTAAQEHKRDPMKAAQEAMRKPLPKRFYKDVSIENDAETGFSRVLLDGRAIKTPGKNAIAVSSPIADMLAAEFEAQGETIDPATMPVYRLINTAFDGVASDPQAVAEDIVRFAGSDLLCYRADTPQELVQRQADGWDDVLDWAGRQAGCAFEVASGVMHVQQPKAAIAGFNALIGQFRDPTDLAALHLMTTLTGSAFLALAIRMGEIEPEEAWAAAHIDEDWTNEQWGEDAEALALRKSKERDLMAAAKVSRTFL